MESGYVERFFPAADRLYGFLRDRKGDTVFFHYSDGRTAKVSGPGEVVLEEHPLEPLPFPKPGDCLKFERSKNQKGVKARPWCFEGAYARAEEKSKRELRLDEAVQWLKFKQCDVFEYTVTASSMTATVTEITWYMTDDDRIAASGTFVTTSWTYCEKLEHKGHVIIYAPDKKYKPQTKFTGEDAEALRKHLIIQRKIKGVKAGTLWNGGWDDYVIDPASTRDMTPEEIEKHGGSAFPTFDSWLCCKFARQFGTENQVVKILRHLGGGD